MPSSADLALLSDALRKLEPFIGSTNAETISETEGLRDHEFLRLQQMQDDGSDCLPCLHSIIFGYWGYPLTKADVPAATHCHVCHRSWRSVKEAHCVVCHAHFSSNEAASFHWNEKTGQHTDVEDCMRQGNKGKRYSPIDTEYGVLWQLSRYMESR